jgi:hypothetical protein
MPLTRSGPRLLAPDDWLAQGAALGRLRDVVADPDAALTGARVDSVRANADARTLLGLVLEWRGASGVVTTHALVYASSGAVAAAARRAERMRRVPPAAGPDLAVLPDSEALFLAFPNDPWLRGLRAAADVRGLARLLGPGRPSSRDCSRVIPDASAVEAVRWKPGRRAVLQAHLAVRDESSGEDGGVHPYVRVYRRAELAARHAAWRRAAVLTHVRVPRLLAIDEAHGFVVVEELEGSPLPMPWSPLQWFGLATAMSTVHQPAVGEEHRIASVARDRVAAVRALRRLVAWDATAGASASALEGRLCAASEALPRIDSCRIHGDFAAAKVLWRAEDIGIADWDETRSGDPHADWASLAAGATLRDAADASNVVEVASRALGSRWSEERWRWQLAAAWSRRVLSALERGEPGWREHAAQTLERARNVADPSARRRRGAPRQPTSLDRWLGALQDPAARRAWGVAPDQRLSLVWPEPEGACARFDHESGGGPLWLRHAERIERWPWPADPWLGALAALARSPRYRALGHRLGRRAALRSSGGDPHVLHLRPERSAEAVTARLEVVHDALAEQGVLVSGPIDPSPALCGWRVPWVEGVAFDALRHDDRIAEAIGDVLARVHRIRAPRGLAIRTIADAVLALQHHQALVERAGGSRASRLARLSDRALAGSRRLAPASSLTIAHGNLHPAQLLIGDDVVVLDWDHARRGEPEEDLGHLAAHLLWHFPARAVGAWAALASAYRDAGGVMDPARVRAFADLAWVRVLSIHSWTDAGRADAEGWLERGVLASEVLP